MNIDAVLHAKLVEREQQQLYRRRLVVDSPQGREIIIEGKSHLSFCSNDYLGLANHPEVVKAAQDAINRFGVGSGASHLVNGHSRLHHELEEHLAVFTGRQRALLFSSGYMANMGTISTLVNRGDTVYEDRLNHASLLDGGLLSGAKFQRFHHNDITDLNNRLERDERARRLIIVDGVFSMDGDVAPLDKLAKLADQHEAMLMVDDAHGLGVIGATGGGTTEYFNLDQDDVPILMGTLGKAFGVCGAFVAGSETLIETLIQFARNYIYTTDLPPAVAGATLKSLQLIQQDTWRREKLHSLISRFRQGAADIGCDLLPSATPIQPILLHSPEDTLSIGRGLKEKGFLVGIIRPPTVPEGSSRLRITLSANHDESDVDALLATLDELLKS